MGGVSNGGCPTYTVIYVSRSLVSARGGGGERYYQPQELGATRLIFYRAMDRKQEAAPRWYFGSRVMYKLVRVKGAVSAGFEISEECLPCLSVLDCPMPTSTLTQVGAVSLSLPEQTMTGLPGTTTDRVSEVILSPDIPHNTISPQGPSPLLDPKKPGSSAPKSSASKGLAPNKFSSDRYDPSLMGSFVAWSVVRLL